VWIVSGKCCLLSLEKINRLWSLLRSKQDLRYCINQSLIFRKTKMPFVAWGTKHQFGAEIYFFRCCQSGTISSRLGRHFVEFKFIPQPFLISVFVPSHALKTLNYRGNSLFFFPHEIYNFFRTTNGSKSPPYSPRTPPYSLLTTLLPFPSPSYTFSVPISPPL
jgi:hypothetical protein